MLILVISMVTIQVLKIAISHILIPSSGSKGGRSAENAHVSPANGINTSGSVNIDVNVPELLLIMFHYGGCNDNKACCPLFFWGT